MIAEEYKNILELYKQISAKRIQPDTLEKVYFQAFIWHFTEKRNWTDEILKKQAIKLEITKLENLLSGEASEKSANYYFNQQSQYLHFNLTENQTIQAELTKAAERGEIKLQPRQILKAMFEAGFRTQQKSPEELLDKIAQSANDLSKQELHLSSKIDNTVLGYQTVHDSRTEPLLKALVQFKEYLGDYGKPNNSLAELRFKSNLRESEIRAYFSQLLKVNTTESRFKGKPILQKEELNNFLYANFQNFNPAASKKSITANCSKASLTRFFYELYNLENQIHQMSASILHRILQTNFSNFEKTELKTIRKEFARVRPVHYPFD